MAEVNASTVTTRASCLTCDLAASAVVRVIQQVPACSIALRGSGIGTDAESLGADLPARASITTGPAVLIVGLEVSACPIAAMPPGCARVATVAAISIRAQRRAHPVTAGVTERAYVSAASTVLWIALQIPAPTGTAFPPGRTDVATPPAVRIRAQRRANTIATGTPRHTCLPARPTIFVICVEIAAPWIAAVAEWRRADAGTALA